MDAIEFESDECTICEELPVIFDKGVPIGFNPSDIDAEMICNENPDLTWQPATATGLVEYSNVHQGFVRSFWIKMEGTMKNITLKLMTVRKS